MSDVQAADRGYSRILPLRSLGYLTGRLTISASFVARTDPTAVGQIQCLPDLAVFEGPEEEAIVGTNVAAG